MAKDLVNMSLLFDLYGGVLTAKQHDFFQYYYEEDLSLAEIAQNEGITRQGVRDAIGRAEETLRDMEAKLGLVGRLRAWREAAAGCARLAYEISAVNRENYFDARIEEKTASIIKIMGSCE
jgi:predicted DNA-binding protein YlxM (UPF0122 family)